MKGIVYTSKTGFTRKYAEMLGKKTGLPVASLKDAAYPKGAEVIYLGWISAGKLKGYDAAAKRYQVKAVCAVGLGGPEVHQEKTIVERQKITQAPVFYLQGGYAPHDLKGLTRWLMGMITGAQAKTLLQKENRTPKEEEELRILTQGGSYVSEENLADVMAWWEGQKAL